MNTVAKNKIHKAFKIKELFLVKNLKPLHKVNLVEVRDVNSDSVPYISRTEKYNGVNAFVKKESYSLNEGNCITFGAETLKFFYQPADFLCGNKMYGIYGKEVVFNKYIGLYLCQAFSNGLKGTNFGFGMGLTGKRLEERSILLPINSKESPDWEYMQQYIQLRLNKVNKVYKVPVINHTCDKRDLADLDWERFFMEDVLEINSGIRLTSAEMKPGTIAFIGASDKNNGITKFVSNINSSTDRNLIGINYNGSVGEVFYHPYQATFSDDVKRVKWKHRENNKYNMLFLKTVILQQKPKYAYGYKFNATRMKRQIILLPVEENGKIAYDFMEQYMKRKENECLKRLKEKNSR